MLEEGEKTNKQKDNVSMNKNEVAYTNSSQNEEELMGIKYVLAETKNSKLFWKVK